MDAHAMNLMTAFGFGRQLMAPLFQRPYVWNKRDQWEPLWNDIRVMAERRLEGKEGCRPHFMGAIVLDQLKVPFDKPDTRFIIDGQQRLATLQIFMAAFRDACKETTDDEKVPGALKQLIFNDDPMIVAPDDRFKVWPTNLDRVAYRTVMTAGSPRGASDSLKALDAGRHEKSRLAEAYLYFCDVISKWLQESPADPVRRSTALLHALRNDLSLVIIDMGEDDDAQVIFETLNARGTPLLPSDLVKNFLFHQAQEEQVDVERLHATYWQPFEEEDAFWRQAVRQGRLKRPRIDLFLQHYLTLMTNQEVPATNLFAAFLQFADGPHSQTAEWYLRSLREHGELFHGFFNSQDGSREGRFFERLQIMDTTTVFPFLLGVYHRLKSTREDEKTKLDITDVVESFLVRRMVCRLTTKNYNRLFLDLLNFMRKRDEFTADAVKEFLRGQEGDSVRWPDDRELEAAWLRTPLYNKIARARLRMLLHAIDAGLHGPKTEKYSLIEELTIEHMLPQEWDRHWPLPVVPAESSEARIERTERRNQLLHSIGNLTLLTKSLNPSVSNGPYRQKRAEVLNHSAINLNRMFEDVEHWNEDDIIRRGKALFEVARRLWRA